MKLFQIEEPDGTPVDPDAPGTAIGIALVGAQAEVAVAVGGNAVMLADRDGFALNLPVPPRGASAPQWQSLFEGARLRAERALAQPVTHVVVVAPSPDAALGTQLEKAAVAAGLSLLRIIGTGEIAGHNAAALGAAILAEDLAPRPAAP